MVKTTPWQMSSKTTKGRDLISPAPHLDVGMFRDARSKLPTAAFLFPMLEELRGPDDGNQSVLVAKAEGR